MNALCRLMSSVSQLIGRRILMVGICNHDWRLWFHFKCSLEIVMGWPCRMHKLRRLCIMTVPTADNCKYKYEIDLFPTNNKHESIIRDGI
jgi:hypothetical protein